MARNYSDGQVSEINSLEKAEAQVHKREIFGFHFENEHEKEFLVGVLLAEDINDAHDEGVGQDDVSATEVPQQQEGLVSLTVLITKVKVVITKYSP